MNCENCGARLQETVETSVLYTPLKDPQVEDAVVFVLCPKCLPLAQAFLESMQSHRREDIPLKEN